MDKINFHRRAQSMLEDFNPHIFYYVSKRCDPSWSLMPPAPLPFNDLTFVLQGEAVYWLEGIPFTVHAGEAVFIPEGTVRAAKTQGMECMAFNFFSNIRKCFILILITIKIKKYIIIVYGYISIFN